MKKIVLMLLIITPLSVRSEIQEQKPPDLKIPPYKIPTFSGKPNDFKKFAPAMQPAMEVDSDILFQAVVNCFPERVALGIADTTEQVSYLEKVIDAQSKLNDAEAGLNGARLALVGQCRDEMVDAVNNHILQVIGK